MLKGFKFKFVLIQLESKPEESEKEKFSETPKKNYSQDHQESKRSLNAKYLQEVYHSMESEKQKLTEDYYEEKLK